MKAESSSVTTAPHIEQCAFSQLGPVKVRNPGALRVLVVDDNQGLAENLAEILELVGCATEIAFSAEQVHSSAFTRDLDMLITDFRLPGKSGAQLVAAMRAKSRRLFALVMSANCDDSTLRAVRDAGAEFRPKPLDLAALCQLVRSVGWSTP